MVAEQEKAEFLQQQPDAKVENGKSVEFNVQDSDSKLTLQDFCTKLLLFKFDWILFIFNVLKSFQ